MRSFSASSAGSVSLDAVVSIPSMRSVVLYVSFDTDGKLLRIRSTKLGLCKGPAYMGPARCSFIPHCPHCSGDDGAGAKTCL